jgi:RNA polymerase sigma-70 factor (ECF subfamily)
MGSRDAAEDVFQETFLQIHQSLDTFDRTRRFKPWLFTIAANKGRDALRKRKRRQAVSLNTPLDADGGGELVDLLDIDIPEVGSEIEQEELSALVQQALDELPPRLREILLLAYFQKMSYAQVAEVFGIPIGTVKSRLHSAVGRFAKKWKELSEERARASENRSANGSG